VRESNRKVEETTMRYFKEMCPPELIKNENLQKKKITMVNESVVIFTSSFDKDSFESDQIDFFFMDEAHEIPENCFDVISDRLRNPYVPGSAYRGILVMNPRTKQHWVYKRFFESKNPRFMLYQNSTRENEKNLPEGYVDDLTSRLTPEMRKRFVDGEWGMEMVGVPVYGADFFGDLHVRSLKYNPHRPLIRSFDFGFHHPACLFMQLDEDGRLLVLREELGENETLHRFASRITAITNQLFPECREFQTFCDIAGSQKTDKGDMTSVEILTSVLGHSPNFQKLSIQKSIESVRKRLRTLIAGKPMLLIDSGCSNLIEGMTGGYHYSETKEDVIEKDGFYDHLQDCLRYGEAGLSSFADVSVQETYEELSEYIPNNSFTGY
jgi:PBSX family phage terminase large subunit